MPKSRASQRVGSAAVAPDGHDVPGARVVLLVALAVFATESAWNFYDAQVPPLLKEHVASAAVIGLVMGMDNFLGIFIQPWIGNASDRTRTRRGRRMPYLLVGIPVAAVLFALIPHAGGSLPLLILAVFAFALVGNSVKPVSESLLPDYVSPRRRSEAHAVVKIATGLTIIVSALVSIYLIDDHPTAAFLVPAGLMLVSVAVLGLTVRDSDSPGYRAALADDAALATSQEVRPRVRDILRDIVTDADRSRVLLILVIVLFAGAWASSRALMTPYGMETLDLSRGKAGGMTLPAGLVFLLAAYPAALMARRFGTVRIIISGMVLFIAAMVLGTAVATPAGTVVAMCVASVGYAGFAINAAVLLWNLAPSDAVVGTYTGIYTIGAASGAALGPFVVGALVDLTGWRFMLLDVGFIAALAVAAAVALSASQTRGRPGPRTHDAVAGEGEI
ncbi:MFS family permease [Nocardioides zeae]|uniref:MFS family permease n=1 Tax=Nocardioides zeae TaxID=1457234 RepID=A0ACC6IGY0_9ACTN|nr:MFS transporter [Nocardioides zeae]MDR6173027.1 MFS family permease [Nocardioides zeae]MDR6210020.1 MFS family permease [Nocardioides zeae]